MDPFRRRDKAVGEPHSPGQGRWNTVVPIAGQQAANSADSVAKRGGGGGDVTQLQERDLVAAGEKDKRGDPGDQAAKPGEAELAEKLADRVRQELARALQHVIELGAD